MKATARPSTQIYGVEIEGTDREKEMEGEGDRSGSQDCEYEEKQKRGRERRRRRGGGEEQLFSQMTRIDLWPSSG